MPRAYSRIGLARDPITASPERSELRERHGIKLLIYRLLHTHIYLFILYACAYIIMYNSPFIYNYTYMYVYNMYNFI